MAASSTEETAAAPAVWPRRWRVCRQELGLVWRDTEEQVIERLPQMGRRDRERRRVAAVGGKRRIIIEALAAQAGECKFQAGEWRGSESRQLGGRLSSHRVNGRLGSGGNLTGCPVKQDGWPQHVVGYLLKGHERHECQGFSGGEWLQLRANHDPRRSARGGGSQFEKRIVAKVLDRCGEG